MQFRIPNTEENRTYIQAFWSEYSNVPNVFLSKVEVYIQMFDVKIHQEGR
jgi:hypothetical protein